MKYTNPYSDLPNIYFGEDGNTFNLMVDNQSLVVLKWDEGGNNRISYNAPFPLNENIKQQISILEERLINSK